MDDEVRTTASTNPEPVQSAAVVAAVVAGIGLLAMFGVRIPDDVAVEVERIVTAVAALVTVVAPIVTARRMARPKVTPNAKVLAYRERPGAVVLAGEGAVQPAGQELDGFATVDQLAAVRPGL